MSLRDWFAGQAMVGLLANERAGSNYDAMGGDMFARYGGSAYRFADALIAARKAGGGA